MASINCLVVWLTFVATFQISNGLYFVQKNLNFSISIDKGSDSLEKSGIIIHRAVALLNKSGDVNFDKLSVTVKCTIDYKINQGKLLVIASNKTVFESSCPSLAIDNVTGIIVLKNISSLLKNNVTRCEYQVTATHGKSVANSVITLAVSATNETVSSIIKGQKFMDLQIEENLKANVTVAYFNTLIPHGIIRRETASFGNVSFPGPQAAYPPTSCILSPPIVQSYLLINASSGAIQTTSIGFDREKLNFNKINFTLACSYDSNANITANEINGTITVLDVNDNPPFLYNKRDRPTNKTRLINISMMKFKKYEHGTRIYPEEPTKLFFKDMDTVAVNQNYEVISYNDTLSLFEFTLKYYTISGHIMEAYYPIHTGLFLNINFTENAGYVSPWTDQYCILVGVKDVDIAKFPSVHFLICVDWSGLIVTDQITPTQVLNPNQLVQRLIPFVGFAQIGNNAASLSRVLTPYPKLITDYTNAVANLTFDIIKIYVETKKFDSKDDQLAFALSPHHETALSYSSSPSPTTLSSPSFSSTAKIAPVPLQGLFGITHTMGQIYLVDSDLLSKSLKMGFDLFYVEVYCQSNVISSFKKNVTVLINNSNDNATTSKKSNSSSSQSKCSLLSLCAKEQDQSACETTCGFASAFGLCRWITTPYFSCTASSPSSGFLNFCPDTFCDELEKLNSGSCPQDCHKRLEEKSKGQLRAHHFTTLDEHQEELINQTSFHGIAECKNNGLVSCMNDMTCSCQYNFEKRKNSSINPTKPSNKTTVSSNSSSDMNNKGENESSQNTTTVQEIDGWFISWIVVFFAFITTVTVCAITAWAVGFFLTSKKKLSGVKRKCDEENPVAECPAGEQTIKENNADSAILESRINEQSPTSSSNNTTDCAIDDEIQKKFLACMEELWKIKQAQLIFTEIQLGKGNFGSVMKAFYKQNVNSSNEVCVAIKSIESNDPKITKSVIWDNIFYEFKFMVAVKEHPNVLNVHGIYSDQNKKPFLVMEMAPFGSLRQVLLTAELQNQELKATVLCNFAYQVASGMEFLASKNIIHRDIATRNVLLFENDICKLADFGLSRYLTRGEYSNNDDEEYAYQLTNFASVRVPVRWMAVESLKDGQYSTKSDVWSFGVLLWELFSYAMLPYPDWDDHTLYYNLEAGQRMQIPDKCPQEIYEIMTRCWQLSPSNRPSFTAIKTLLSSYNSQLRK